MQVPFPSDKTTPKKAKKEDDVEDIDAKLEAAEANLNRLRAIKEAKAAEVCLCLKLFIFVLTSPLRFRP